jgi:hypothetical protein
MIPSTKKEWDKWELDWVSREFAWKDADKYEQKKYMLEALKTLDLEKKFSNTFDIEVAITAKKLLWDELETAKQKGYTAQAQKKLARDNAKLNK